jgi:uncharacterized membrane protein
MDREVLGGGEMRTIRKTILQTLLVVVASLGMVEAGLGQFGTNDSAIRDIVRRIQTHTSTLRTSAQNAADRGNYSMNQLNQLLVDLDTATTQFDRRLSYRRATADDARLVLEKGTPIDNLFANNRGNRSGTFGDWQRLRSDLDQLAQAYSLNWQWNNTSSDTGAYQGGTYNNSSLTDIQLRQLIQRIDSRTTTFSRNFRNDLNRQNTNDRSHDQVRQQLSSFETAVVQIRNRVNTRQIASSDVNNLLQSAAFLNNYIQNRRLGYQTQNSWSPLRTDLDQLASAFNIAWNWSTYPSPGGYPGNSGYPGRGDLTGTYRIAASQSDDARRAVDDATRNLSLAERQRVYDSLLRRLDPPQMLAIDRRGNSVTIASTRAPQISFVADGREQVETTQSGRTVRVRAQIVGDQLSISRTGDRADDFSVNFDLTDGGRRLLVTRTLSSDRLSQTITVRTSYDRTADVAQLNIYETNRENPSGGSSDVAGTFVIPNGTEIVAVLNGDLTTQNAHENDRFTMTVRSPGQYEGATIEGSVTGIDRGGRVSGRSQMTLDFDTIRLRDGRSYRFAGILENVRMPNGDVVRVDNEGAVRESDQTNKTIQRTAIGTAVGAIIGAIAGGGKGAAIGAIVGAGAGAGSVYVQGRNDLELTAGTEMTVRATGPRNN